MRIEGQRESDNIEDRRGMGPARLGGRGGLGIGTIVLVLAVSYFTGANPLTVFNMITGVQSVTETMAPSAPSESRPGRRSRRPTRQVCLRRPRRHGNHLAQPPWSSVRGPAYGPLFRSRPVGMRHYFVCSGSVLLPERSPSLSRPCLLRRDGASTRSSGRLRAGLCDRS